MNGARLHTLGSADLDALHADCSLQSDRNRHPSRAQMVADILAWQQRWQAQESVENAAPPEARSCPRHEIQSLATPMRQRRGVCSECGWAATSAAGGCIGLCACGFLEMDPLRPVAAVLCLANFYHKPGSDAEVARLAMTIKCADLQLDGDINLRMCKVGQPRCHVWPQAMILQVDDSEVLRVDPPQDGQAHRADAPIRIEPRDRAQDCRLVVHARMRSSERSEFVLCLVRLAPPVGLAALLSDCVARPEITSSDSAQLLARLRTKAYVGVECATPWVQPLLCPLSRDRMRLPVRGVDCRHLRCFDLEAYLETSIRAAFHRRWRCPVCDVILMPAELAVCTFTRALLDQEGDAASVPLGLVAPLASSVSAISGPADEASCRSACERDGLATPGQLGRDKVRRRWRTSVLSDTAAGDGALRPEHGSDSTMGAGKAWGDQFRLRVGPPVTLDL